MRQKIFFAENYTFALVPRQPNINKMNDWVFFPNFDEMRSVTKPKTGTSRVHAYTLASVFTLVDVQCFLCVKILYH